MIIRKPKCSNLIQLEYYQSCPLPGVSASGSEMPFWECFPIRPFTARFGWNPLYTSKHDSAVRPSRKDQSNVLQRIFVQCGRPTLSPFFLAWTRIHVYTCRSRHWGWTISTNLLICFPHFLRWPRGFELSACRGFHSVPAQEWRLSYYYAHALGHHSIVERSV